MLWQSWSWNPSVGPGKVGEGLAAALLFALCLVGIAAIAVMLLRWRQRQTAYLPLE